MDRYEEVRFLLRFVVRKVIFYSLRWMLKMLKMEVDEAEKFEDVCMYTRLYF